MRRIEVPMVPRLLDVTRVRREYPGVVTFELDPGPLGGHFAFTQGQFNMLYAFGAGEAPISISGDPRKTERIVHTVRAVGPVTRKFERLKKGDTVGLRGPFGGSWPLGDAVGRHILFIGGGLGLAPLRPAIYEALARRETFADVALLYGTQNPDTILYRSEVEKWTRQKKMDVLCSVDRAHGGWEGNVGVVTMFLDKMLKDPVKTSVFMCGPEVMMRIAAEALLGRGVDARMIFLSMERNMQCAVGHCGHCQLGPHFICKDGPVFEYARMRPVMSLREV